MFNKLVVDQRLNIITLSKSARELLIPKIILKLLIILYTRFRRSSKTHIDQETGMLELLIICQY